LLRRFAARNDRAVSRRATTTLSVIVSEAKQSSVNAFSIWIASPLRGSQ
jgi:hypothetical protein